MDRVDGLGGRAGGWAGGPTPANRVAPAPCTSGPTTGEKPHACAMCPQRVNASSQALPPCTRQIVRGGTSGAVFVLLPSVVHHLPHRPSPRSNPRTHQSCLKCDSTHPLDMRTRHHAPISCWEQGRSVLAPPSACVWEGVDLRFAWAGRLRGWELDGQAACTTAPFVPRTRLQPPVRAGRARGHVRGGTGRVGGWRAAAGA